MAKKMDINLQTISSLGTQYKWYKGTDVELLSNDGKTDIRVDKLMVQASCQHSGTGTLVVGYIMHFSDETGAALSTSINSGTTDDSMLEVLLNQWKDNVFMTDFRMVGTGGDENVLSLVPLEANTRRLMKPGQKLYATPLVQPTVTETSKTSTHYFDSILWYSAAAQ